jgi:hypothetical protein
MKMQNKITHAIMGVAAGAALLLAAGCSKQEPPAGETPKPAEAPKPAAEAASAAAAVSQAAASVVTQAQQTAASVAAAAQQAVSAATNQAAAAGAEATSQVQTLIEKAKGLVTDEKYKDALTVVQQLASAKLTPEQRTLVDGLKAQIQTALAKSTTSDAASALGNALGGKK